MQPTFDSISWFRSVSRKLFPWHLHIIMCDLLTGVAAVVVMLCLCRPLKTRLCGVSCCGCTSTMATLEWHGTLLQHLQGKGALHCQVTTCKVLSATSHNTVKVSALASFSGLSVLHGWPRSNNST